MMVAPSLLFNAVSYPHHIFILGLAGALLLPMGFVPVKDASTELAPDSFVRAVAVGDEPLFNLSIAEGLDINARNPEGHTALWIATSQRKHDVIVRVLEMGANVDIPDRAGRTPLMIATVDGDVGLLREFVARSRQPNAPDSDGRSAAHHAIAAHQKEAIAILLPLAPELPASAAEGSGLLALAIATGEPEMISAVLDRMPAGLEWSAQTRRALSAAIEREDSRLVRALVARHATAPTALGTEIPLLAHSIVTGDLKTFRALLKAGGDPNTTVPTPCPKEFVSALQSNYLRSYVKGDEGVTLLMLAAGLGKPDHLRALLDAGADRNRQTVRHKMLALYFAARTEKWKCVQMLLGTGPMPEQLRVEISLASQRATIFKDGVKIFETACSTGREGFPTPAGSFVITDKKKDHISSIYKVAMPFFMRLNCRDFGLHAGNVPNYPASHGCIRLPAAAAQKLFSELPVGTLVMIN